MRFDMQIERLSDGQAIFITGEKSEYTLLSVDGIEVPEIDMASYDIASVDGVVLSNIRVPDKEITVSLIIRRDVDRNRRRLHQLCRVRSLMRLWFWTKSGGRYIDGYVKSITSDRFSDPNFTFDITFDCPDPYFKDQNHLIVDMSRDYGTFFFPFGMSGTHKRPVAVTDNLRTATINSTSENETGIIIRIRFRVSASSVRITNADTGEWFEVRSSFLPGDILEINTIDGQKDVVRMRGSVDTSLIASIVDGSTFFQLQSGNNRFNYVLDNEVSKTGADMELDFTPIYLSL